MVIRTFTSCIHSTRRPFLPFQRHLSSTASRHSTARYYRYAVDVHGQLFLHDTTPKNLTSCFKNPQFLDFFFARVKPNVIDSSSSAEKGAEEKSRHSTEAQKSEDDDDWTEREGLTVEEATRIAKMQRYNWISPCQGEINFIRADRSPIVFRELEEDGELGSEQLCFLQSGSSNCH
jgi:hypothetical protein